MNLFDPTSRWWLARDYVPISHRGLPIARVLFPYEDASGEAIRWSRVADLDELPASASWADVVTQTPWLGAHPALQPKYGQVETALRRCLIDILPSLSMTTLSWTGYGNPFRGVPTLEVGGDVYAVFRVPTEDALRQSPLPTFAWDDAQQLAWGMRLYPDSMVVAATPPVMRAMAADDRLDVRILDARSDPLPAYDSPGT